MTGVAFPVSRSSRSNGQIIFALVRQEENHPLAHRW
jgi:hypothetical protein